MTLTLDDYDEYLALTAQAEAEIILSKKPAGLVSPIAMRCAYETMCEMMTEGLCALHGAKPYSNEDFYEAHHAAGYIERGLRVFGELTTRAWLHAYYRDGGEGIPSGLARGWL